MDNFEKGIYENGDEEIYSDSNNQRGVLSLKQSEDINNPFFFESPTHFNVDMRDIKNTKNFFYFNLLLTIMGLITFW